MNLVALDSGQLDSWASWLVSSFSASFAGPSAVAQPPNFWVREGLAASLIYTQDWDSTMEWFLLIQVSSPIVHLVSYTSVLVILWVMYNISHSWIKNCTQGTYNTLESHGIPILHVAIKYSTNITVWSINIIFLKWSCVVALSNRLFSGNRLVSHSQTLNLQKSFRWTEIYAVGSDMSSYNGR